jgi:hypothetical protein
MNTFFDLFARMPAPAPGAAVSTAEHEFEELVKASPCRLWHPGDTISERGLRILLGVAPWSGYDMRLLDVIIERLSGAEPAAAHVDVFSTGAWQTRSDVKRYIPKMRPEVLQTPVVEVSNNGAVTATKQGYEARELVARTFGSSSADIVDYVQKWRERRVGVCER